MQTYYDAGPWTQGIRSIGSMLAQRPYIQAMQRQREEQSRLTAATTQDRLATADYTRARTAETNTKTDRQKLQLSSALKIQNIMSQPGAVSQDEAGNITFSAPALQAAMASVSGMGTGANDTALGMGTLLEKANKVPQFKQKLAADTKVKEENNIRDNATRAARPIVAGNGATVIDPMTGAPIAEAAYTLAPGQNRYAARGLSDLFNDIQLDPNAKAAPIATGQPVPPKSSALEQTRARLAASLLEKEMPTNQIATALSVFDEKTAAPVVQAGPSATNAPPKVGEVRKGYRFKGGNPGDKNNWEPL